ncbi:MAG TPA: hypothetical protein VEY30_01995 [Myxococcaceae bacterium]|nr:hypothetical protein [Myxococcaceae bacterium]
MGTTSEMITMGMNDGIMGCVTMPHPSDMLGDYFLPYIDGYRMGFMMRKVGVTYARQLTHAEEQAEGRLHDLMVKPRYRHPLTYNSVIDDLDGTYATVEHPNADGGAEGDINVPAADVWPPVSHGYILARPRMADGEDTAER